MLLDADDPLMKIVVYKLDVFGVNDTKKRQNNPPFSPPPPPISLETIKIMPVFPICCGVGFGVGFFFYILFCDFPIMSKILK